ncbi:NUDIX domain-containing protein [Sphingorhabdus sp. Alg239-R122]|uniref:NUDIX domain-containing protein n=1 Tax=Sphingorhabdus sp. Alg239-R122 TaxID=2305989 RepID=UPI0013D9BA1A|nr:NUDIX domain-containing protein [Sphingorhabdus sp. Alg239-R122]
MTDSHDNSRQHRDPITEQKLAPAIDAATVVIFRDTPLGQPPELLMVERSAKMAFAAGAAVFPGGRIDPEDFTYAGKLGYRDDGGEGASRIAAIRETIEETGLAIGFIETPEEKALADARAQLHAGKSLQSICTANGWHLDLEMMVPFARWRPSFAEARIFDTRFYLANAGAGRDRVLVDETENRHLFWASASDVLHRADTGALKIIFPTRRNLERLAQFTSHDEAVSHACTIPVRTITPYIEERGGTAHLCIPGGFGYPVTSEALRNAKRG